MTNWCWAAGHRVELARAIEFGPEAQKFDNRLLGPTILLFLCFEQLTAEPIFLFRTQHTIDPC
jgi:hypothetical protein